jgi:hypothetical protein
LYCVQLDALVDKKYLFFTRAGNEHSRFFLARCACAFVGSASLVASSVRYRGYRGLSPAR